jgi:hypothetical protein
LIDGVTTYYYDADATNNVNFYFYRLSGTSGSGFSSTLLLQDASSGSAGYQGGYDAFSHTVWNYDTQTGMYLMVVNIDPSGTATNLAFGGALVWYSLQVSPAPGTATFADVPVGAFGFQHVEALVASGITSGCGGGNFCPNDPLTRVQMAVFLAKALGLHWED